MSAPVGIRSSVNCQNVRADSSAVVFVAIDLRPEQATQILQKMNISLAIDCSYSMAGDKLDNAIAAAVGLSRQLNPLDWISMVSFERDARVLLEASQLTDPDVVEATIRGLSLGGLTDLHGGLDLSYRKVLKNSRVAGTISRVILLTDGKPTSGITKAEEFVTLAQGIRADGITVTTIGIGDDYNDSLLTEIAQNGGGLWYHIKDPHRDLPGILREQISEMAATVMMSPELNVSFLPGSDVLNIYTVRPMLSQLIDVPRTGNNYRIRLRDLIAGEEQNLVFRIRVPPRQAGVYRLLHAELRNMSQDLTITYTADPRLYNNESDAYPSLLLQAAEGTILMRRSLTTGDQTLVKEAGTILRRVTADPRTPTVINTNPVVQEVLTPLQDAYSFTLNESMEKVDKKDLVQGTTIIGKKKQE